MQPLTFAPVQGRGDSFAPLPSDSVRVLVLTANVAKAVTVPAGARMVLISGLHSFFATFDGVAASIPVADVDADTVGTPVLNPTSRAVAGGDEISVISANNTILTFEFWG